MTTANKKRKSFIGRGGEAEDCDSEEDEQKEMEEGVEMDGDEEEKYEKMTEEEIAIWCSRYKDVKEMKAYIMVEKEEPRIQERFVATLAKVAMLKDNRSALASECGILYQWIWRFEHGMGGRNPFKVDKACSVPLLVKKEIEGEIKKTPNCVLPTGWKWVMQLRATDGKWVDWIQIQKSNRPGARLGVFSARDFPKGSTIGYCCGSTTWESNIPGSAKPIIDRRKVRMGENEDKGVTFRNSKGKWQTVVAKKVESERTGEQPLFLGMHYVKSATYGFEPNSREFDKVSKNQNCCLLDDGSMKALKKISPNVEILLL